ncbi:hypothetical protein GCM10018980_72370 [Streptomyces capoamus]|uniref:Uncharacterized protein n=1 Tax=Streptomyces capoamus TaxID=68183 RepID=A0A919F3N8_9ACTN|nr:hypothetical protein GCM10010501_17010 [Streptomyces libani subsp. rufus]GHG75073.1 hypothetical protein GCM10018980_72370 [Streptomyces capoamus]
MGRLTGGTVGLGTELLGVEVGADHVAAAGDAVVAVGRAFAQGDVVFVAAEQQCVRVVLESGSVAGEVLAGEVRLQVVPSKRWAMLAWWRAWRAAGRETPSPRL